MANPTTHTKRMIEYRKVEVLQLDPENPRLTAPGGHSPEQLLAWMLKEEAIEELAASLSENGYFSEEPLVVVPDLKKPGKFFVVEGNRRLAALKLLLDPALRAKLGAVDFPQPTPERLADLAEVPTVEYANREEVVPYLGFRHITGVKTWDPYAKAKYVSQLVDSGRKIGDIEQGIGDAANTVKKLYQSLVVYTQAVKELSYPAKDLRSSFSLLEVALSQQPIKRYVGLPRELPQQKTQRLVDDDHLAKLREVLSWVFGDSSKGELKVIADSRQISQRLAPVIAEEESLEYLKRTRDLEGAYERSGGERQFLLKQVATAYRASGRALSVAPNHKGERDVKVEVERLVKVVEALSREVG